MNWLLFWLVDDKPDYTQQVAVECAYVVTTQNDKPLVPINKPDPNCKECKGTGKIRTGDGISWTECDCVSRPAAASTPPAPTATHATPKPLQR